MTTNPFHLSVATVTGTPQSLADLFLGIIDSDQKLNQLTIRAAHQNTGYIYVGDSNLATATLAGCLGVIGAGEEVVLGSDIEGNRVAWQKYYVHGDSLGDRAIFIGSLT
jgi:hypothetical protein